MNNADDEVFGLFLEESKEHLENIEEDLLSIEKAGADLNEQLVNKVFRAAHTIKGGAGFFGMETVKHLAHSMENILGMIRARELIPSTENVSVLLNGSDLLKNMIQNPASESSTDISTVVSKLEAIGRGESLSAEAGTDKESTSSPSEPEPVEIIQIGWPGESPIFEVDSLTIRNAQRAEKGGSYVYLIKFDLIKDIQRKNKLPWDVIKEFLSISYFIDSKIHFDSVGSLENHTESTVIPLYILCSTVLEPFLMSDCLGVAENQIQVVLAQVVEKDSVVITSSTSTEKATSTEKIPEAVPTQESQSTKAKEQTSIAKPVPSSTPVATETKKAPIKTELPHPPANLEKGNSSTAGNQDKKEPVDTSVRVPLSLLDKLMTLAGELVLTRNELLQNTNEKSIEKMVGTAHRVDSITSELQEAIMATRMQSVGIVFNKFKRVVRDLSRDLGKTINLKLEGEEVELDKTIIEAIGDPMTHLVRNSIDHGIEMPEIRVNSGKPETGEIQIRAFHEAGQVAIVITDDGKGIDPEVIARKAVEKGMYTEAQISRMSQKEITQIIFAAGFSTAEKITDVSGRGVGMDVVISNLTKVGGIVDIDSQKGKGTTVKIKLPLTLAIIPSILIAMETEKFAIPQVNLLELVRVPAKEVKKKIENLGDATVMRLRGELLPIVKISQILGVENPTYRDPETGERKPERRNQLSDRRHEELKPRIEIHHDERKNEDRRKNPAGAIQIAVVSTGDFIFGLIVDQLLDTEEIVVKPLGAHLSHLKGYAGATILGDGNVAFILDVLGLCEIANLKKKQASIEKKKQEIESKALNAENQSLLLVKNNSTEAFLIPLGLVTRIEKIKKDQVLDTGGKRAMTYRGKILLLFKIEDVADIKPLEERDNYFVIVYRIGDHEVGILVSEIQDILSINQEVDEVTHKQPGILGSVVHNEKIVMMLDIFGIADKMAPDLMQISKEKEKPEEKKTILIVEDSPFFLNQIRKFIENAGYNVLVAEDGLKGLAVLKNFESEIDMIVTDIEMPNMNGLEMVQNIRVQAKYSNLPIIAVTSVAGTDAEKAGKAVGINEYLIKLDREQILQACKRYLSGELQTMGASSL